MSILEVLLATIIVILIFWLTIALSQCDNYLRFRQILKHIDEIEYQYYDCAKYHLGIRKEGKTIIQIKMNNNDLFAIDRMAGDHIIVCPSAYFITVRKLRKKLIELIPDEYKEGKRLKIKTFEDYL